MNNYL